MVDVVTESIASTFRRSLQDLPCHADAYTFEVGLGTYVAGQEGIPLCQVQEGDVVVLGTDGFFDNLYDSEAIRFGKVVCINLRAKLRSSSWKLPRMASLRGLPAGASISGGMQTSHLL